MAMAMLLAGAAAVDIAAELNSGWMMGLRPRQQAQNLQSFSGAVGGVSASAVCAPAAIQPTSNAWEEFMLTRV